MLTLNSVIRHYLILLNNKDNDDDDNEDNVRKKNRVLFEEPAYLHEHTMTASFHR